MNQNLSIEISVNPIAPSPYASPAEGLSQTFSTSLYETPTPSTGRYANYAKKINERCFAVLKLKPQFFHSCYFKCAFRRKNPIKLGHKCTNQGVTHLS